MALTMSSFWLNASNSSVVLAGAGRSRTGSVVGLPLTCNTSLRRKLFSLSSVP